MEIGRKLHGMWSGQVHVWQLLVGVWLFALTWCLGFGNASVTAAGEPISEPVKADTERAVVSSGRPAGEVGQFAGIEFVWVPAGGFDMGSNNEGPWESPVHWVTLSLGFWMGKYEVTQAQWEAVMGNNPSYWRGDPQRPVEQVSWYDIQRFITALNSQHPGHSFRLPTEAEWEYACRAGTRTRYCFGNNASDLGAYAWYSENSGSCPHPVGQKRPNAWGLHDMHGNVWESVQDWFGAHPWLTQTDPVGPSSGTTRIRRGGGWYFEAGQCTSAKRLLHFMGFANNSLGFRLAK